MSGNDTSDVADRVDRETAEQVLNSGSEKVGGVAEAGCNDNATDAVRIIADTSCNYATLDLGKVLPKLSKRISQSSSQSKDGATANISSASLDTSGVDVGLDEDDTSAAEDVCYMTLTWQMSSPNAPIYICFTASAGSI
jgi:uncharacterized membrane protein